MTAEDVVEEGPRGEGGGEGGEKLKGKRHTETQHKKEGDRGKGKEVAVEKRRFLCPTQAVRTRRSSLGRESVGWGQEEVL